MTTQLNKGVNYHLITTLRICPKRCCYACRGVWQQVHSRWLVNIQYNFYFVSILNDNVNSYFFSKPMTSAYIYVYYLILRLTLFIFNIFLLIRLPTGYLNPNTRALTGMYRNSNFNMKKYTNLNYKIQIRVLVQIT